MKLQWFRFYSVAVDDESLRLLAFEDRWHFVAILCCKSSGLIDSEKDELMLRRRLAVKLGLDLQTLEDVENRLKEVDLLGEGFQPKNWNRLQFVSDSSSPRVQKHRAKIKRLRNVSETPPDAEAEADAEADAEAEAEAEKFPIPIGVDPQIWSDFLVVRSSKKASITETALKEITAEAARAGLSLSTALGICCARNWAGFNADWVGGQTKSSREKQKFDPEDFVNRRNKKKEGTDAPES